jgi:hypothetical protein
VVILAPSATVTATQIAAPLYLSARIYNAAGEEVRVLESMLPLGSKPQGLDPLQSAFSPQQGGQAVVAVLATGLVLRWDGITSAGQEAASGSYRLEIEVADPFGNRESWSCGLSILNTPGGVLVQVFNSAGELVWSASRGLSGGSTLNLGSRELVQGGAGLKIHYGFSAGDSVDWDGSNGQGQPVQPGTYLIKVSQQDAGGTRKDFTQSVTVLRAVQGIFDSALACPNPAGRLDSSLSVVLKNLAPGATAEGEAYSLAGERVGSLRWVQAQGALVWELSQGLASGIYIIRVEARDPSLLTQRAYLKVVLAR